MTMTGWEKSGAAQRAVGFYCVLLKKHDMQRIVDAKITRGLLKTPSSADAYLLLKENRVTFIGQLYVTYDICKRRDLPACRMQVRLTSYFG